MQAETTETLPRAGTRNSLPPPLPSPSPRYHPPRHDTLLRLFRGGNSARIQGSPISELQYCYTGDNDRHCGGNDEEREVGVEGEQNDDDAQIKRDVVAGG